MAQPEAIKTILDKYGIPNLHVVAAASDVREQEQMPANKVAFSQALEQALRSFFRDDDNLESPRSLVIEQYELYPDEVDDAENQIREKLRHLFGEAELHLLPNRRWRDDDDFDPPADGEPVEDNWVFSLALAKMPDYTFWAIVDRTGKTPAYNYGAQ